MTTVRIPSQPVAAAAGVPAVPVASPPARRGATQARTIEAEAAERLRELRAHFTLAIAVLDYARTVAGLSPETVARLAPLRGDLEPWRETGARLEDLSDTQLHELAAHLTGLHLADHTEIRERCELVRRSRHPGLLAATTLIAVLSRHGRR